MRSTTTALATMRCTRDRRGRFVAAALCACLALPAAARATPLPPSISSWRGVIPLYIAVGEGTARASVNPNGSEVTDCHVDWGLGAFTEQKPCSPSPGTGTDFVDVSADFTVTLTGFYSYRFVATNAGGTTIGDGGTVMGYGLPPFVTSGEPTALASTSVTLHGTVNPHGTQTTCTFEFGTTTAYGGEAPCVPEPGDADQPVAVTATVEVTPGTVLHYRLRGTNANGVSNSPDGTVQIPAATPPTIAGETVQTIARPTATAAATVNPNGSPTECWFESGSQRIPCSPMPGDGTSPVAVTAPIPVFGAIISFRVVASNAGGTTYGPQVGMSVFWVPPPRPGRLRVLSIGRRRHGAVTVRLTCDGESPDSCRGTLTLTARVRLHGRRRVVVLGSAPYSFRGPGAQVVLAVRLSRRARRLLRVHPRLRIAARAIPAPAAP